MLETVTFCAGLFFNQAYFYSSQQSTADCGVASYAMVESMIRGRRVTFHEARDAFIEQGNLKRIEKGGPGFPLDQIKEVFLRILRHRGLSRYSIEVIRGASLDSFRKLLERQQKGLGFLVINFDQARFNGGERAGHYSPVIQYDPLTDQAFVLDPDPEVRPFWTSAKELHLAQDTIDDEVGAKRGLLWISLAR